MAKRMGAARAKGFADSREVSFPDPPNERAMDLYNNAMGRAFAQDSRYQRLSPDGAARGALANHCLRTLK